MDTQDLQTVTKGMTREQLNSFASLKGLDTTDKDAFPSIKVVVGALAEKMGLVDKEAPKPETETLTAREEREHRINAMLLSADDAAAGAENAAKPPEQRDGRLHAAYQARGLSLDQNIRDATRPESWAGKGWAGTKKVATFMGILGGVYVVGKGVVVTVAKGVARLRGPAI